MNNHKSAEVCRGRLHNRSFDQVRPIKITYDAFGYSAGTVLFEIGNTKVLCSVSLQVGVPPFLKGTKTGWLTAEYAMLPTSTVDRTQRESVTQKRSGRSMEISRLIGRALRAVITLQYFGERTIVIDCDVLQADGGTRTASITGSFLALKIAEQRWLSENLIAQPFIVGEVAAISAGILNGQPVVDLDCEEDKNADADFNFVLTAGGNIIELQGSVERGNAIAWDQFEQVRSLALKGVKDIFDHRLLAEPIHEVKQSATNKKSAQEERVPLFSLKNRLNKAP